MLPLRCQSHRAGKEKARIHRPDVGAPRVRDDLSAGIVGRDGLRQDGHRDALVLQRQVPMDVSGRSADEGNIDGKGVVEEPPQRAESRDAVESMANMTVCAPCFGPQAPLLRLQLRVLTEVSKEAARHVRHLNQSDQF